MLCLHLKRFKFVSFHRSKIDTTVEFPLEDLDMSDYVLPSVVRRLTSLFFVYPCTNLQENESDEFTAEHVKLKPSRFHFLTGR